MEPKITFEKAKEYLKYDEISPITRDGVVTVRLPAKLHREILDFAGNNKRKRADAIRSLLWVAIRGGQLGRNNSDLQEIKKRSRMSKRDKRKLNKEQNLHLDVQNELKELLKKRRVE